MTSHQEQDQDYSSEDVPEQIQTFRSADLPILSNPSPFHSEDSSSDSETPYEPEGLSQLSTPATPSTALGTSFSLIGLSSQTLA